MGLRRGYFVIVVCVITAGCTNSHYRKSADKAAYSLIEEKRPLVPNADPRFTIEQTNRVSLDNLAMVSAGEEAFGPEAEVEKGARILSLEKALEIAVFHSRAYQLRKEQVFLEALQLSLARHQFAPIFTGRGRGAYEVNTAQGQAIIIDPITMEPRVLLSDELVEQHRVTGGASL